MERKYVATQTVRVATIATRVGDNGFRYPDKASAVYHTRPKILYIYFNLGLPRSVPVHRVNIFRTSSFLI